MIGRQHSAEQSSLCACSASWRLSGNIGQYERLGWGGQVLSPPPGGRGILLSGLQLPPVAQWQGEVGLCCMLIAGQRSGCHDHLLNMRPAHVTNVDICAVAMLTCLRVFYFTECT